MGDRWRSEDARRARTRARKRTTPHPYTPWPPAYRAPDRCLRCGLPETDPVHIRRPDD